MDLRYIQAIVAVKLLRFIPILPNEQRKNFVAPQIFWILKRNLNTKNISLYQELCFRLHVYTGIFVLIRRCWVAFEKMTRKILLAIGLIIAVAIFLKYGRSVYMPVINKMKGNETVESRITAIEGEVWNRLENNLNLAGYKMDYPKEIILAAFKEERVLQVYSKDYNGIKQIKEYPFTAFSGELGPKLKEGDRQIPEGIYEVEYLNPNSSFYLSIKVSYPNEFDKSKTELSDITDMGGDIFIHGKSATIGCIPIGDEAIEEVFLLTQKAIKNGVKIIISPRDFRTNSGYPKIEGIDWENELYDKIRNEIKTLPNNTYKQ